MTDEAMLTELQGLLEKATAAPWGAINIAGEWELTTLPLSYETPRLGSEERGRGGDDIELAAALRNAAPRLLELARRAKEAKRILGALHAAYALHEDDNEVAADACKWLDRWGAKP